MFLQSKRFTYFLLAAFVLLPFLHLSYLYRPFTEIKWMAIYGLSAAILGVGLLRGKSVQLPSVGLAFWVGVVLIIINQVLVSAFNHVPIANDYSIDRLSFLVFFIAAFNLQSTQPDFLKNLSRAAVLSAVLFACGLFFALLTGSPPIHSDPSMRWLAGSMGDINMAAQLMAFSLPFLVFELLDTRSRQARVLLAATALFLSAAIFVTGCRSVWIGTGALALYYLVFLRSPSSNQRFPSFKKLLAPGLLALGVVVTLSFSLALFPQIRGHLRQKVFASGSDGRLEIWRDTLQMIYDHPFGVGVDQFELAGVREQVSGSGLLENHFWASPHDEPLRILSEEGWIGLLLFGLCAFALLRFLLRQTESDREKRALLVCMIIVWTPELLLQFPLQMANSFLLLALTLGALAASSPAPKAQVSRVFQLCALIFVFCLGGVHCASYLLGSTDRENATHIRLACAIYQPNWRACLHEVMMDARAGDFERAHFIVDRVLSKYPYFYPYLKGASVLAAFEGNNDQSCQYLRRYDQVFFGKSSLHEMMEKNCH